MTIEQLKNCAQVYGWLAEGKKVQGRYNNGEADWIGIAPGYCDYIAPETWEYRLAPEPLVCWVNVYPTGFGAYAHEGWAKSFADPSAIRIAVKMVEAGEGK